MIKGYFFLCLIFYIFIAQAAENPIHVFQLKNGLKIWVKENHRMPIAIVQTWYKVGSGYETNGITGISHVLEHMMFKGSKHYNAQQLLHILTTFGADQNAMTMNDATVYFEKLSPQALDQVFALEADRMQNLLLNDPEVFKKELQVVMEERRLRVEDNPHGIAYERMNAAAWVNSPYHHLTIGWMEDLIHLNLSDVQQWYHKWYAPNNAVLVVVGDVVPTQVYHLAERYFGAVPKISIIPPKSQAEVAPLGLKTVQVQIPATSPILLAAYQVPSAKTAAILWEGYALELLGVILANSNSARLIQNFIHKKQTVAQLEIEYDLYSRLNTLWILSVVPNVHASLLTLQKELLKAIQHLHNSLITVEELNRAKMQLKANRIYSQDSLSDQAFWMGQLAILDYPPQEMDNYFDQCASITPVQIQKVAQKYLQIKRLTIATLEPLFSYPFPLKRAS